MQTIEEARDHLAGRVAKAESLGRAPFFPAPVGVENLIGKVIGDFRVVGYLSASKVTPWWVVRCRRCKRLEPRRGNAIRSRANGRCRSCSVALNASSLADRLAGAQARTRAAQAHEAALTAQLAAAQARS